MVVIDKKIKKCLKVALLRNCRSFFIILGSSEPQKISTLSKLLMKVNKTELEVLWCSQNEISNSESKYMEIDEEEIHFTIKPYHCTYNDLNRIYHRSFHMAVLQDFDMRSLLALNCILTTVKGGGVIIILLPDVHSLDELKKYNLKYEEGRASRFSQRFVNSLNLCSNCLILDENLVLLSASKCLDKPDDMIVSSNTIEWIEEVKDKCKDDQVFLSLINLCITRDQADLLYKYLDILKKRTFQALVSVSSAYGRGKSAALGLAIAGSLALKYSNIFIISSCHSNVNVLFQFLLKGLDTLQYQEDKDYDLIESTNPKFDSALLGLNIFRDHPQSVRFIFPDDIGHKLEQAELVIIDEAASIPIEKLNKLIGPYVVLMSSSITGAKSTSPFLYDAMVENLQQTSKVFKDTKSSTESSAFNLGNSLQELKVSEPVHYSTDDNIEFWSYKLFCMESVTSSKLTFGCPETQQCQLFCVSRDILFNGSVLSERFLQLLMSIFNQSSYLMQPEDLVTLADSPNYEIFVLLPPVSKSLRKTTPEVLCAILVHLEYKIPSDIILCGTHLSGPTPKCFNDWSSEINILPVYGIHILNLATHPSYKRMGYGLRAFQLLQELYEGKLISLDEKMNASCSIADKEIPQEEVEKEKPLLLPLSEIQRENVEYLCVSFSLTSDVFSFWKKAGFIPSFLSPKKDLEGNICFMIKSLTEDFTKSLQKNWLNFKNYFLVLLNSNCQDFSALFALSFLQSLHITSNVNDLTKEELDMYIKPYDMKSLEKYCQRLQDMNSILHIITILSGLYFKDRFLNVHIPVAQEAILLSYGVQKKSIDSVAKDMNLQSIQVIGLLNRTLKKLTNHLTNIIEKTVEKSIVTSDVHMEPLDKDLNEELEEAAEQIKKQQEDKLQGLDVSQYAIKGSEDEWQKALFSGRQTLVSIKSIKKKVEVENIQRGNESKNKFKKQMKKKKK